MPLPMGLCATTREAILSPVCFRGRVRILPRDALVDPKESTLRLPDLVQRMMREHLPVVACEHNGMWLDIGRPDDTRKAQRLVASIRTILMRSSTRGDEHDSMTM